MIRSFLFVPADSPRKLEKSLSTDADALIFDLEDAVAIDRKVAGRKCLAAFLAGLEGQDARRIYVRINDLDSGNTLEDLKVVLPFSPQGYVLPKCRGAQDVERLSLYLDAFETAHGQTVGRSRIIAIATESAQSVFGLASYSKTCPRLAALMWGAEDLGADLGSQLARQNGGFTEPFHLARSLCLMAAASAGVQAIDAVLPDLHNQAVLADECLAAFRDGFTAKAAIHPSQLEVINRAFSFSDTDIAWARQVVEAFSAGEGVAQLEGQMLDRPHLRRAESILQQHSMR
jgi:citrate lyase subunit beta/citryl-CoA lyase